MNLLNKKIPFLPGNFDIKKLLDAGGVIAAVVGAILALLVALGLGGGGGSSWHTPTPTPTPTSSTAPDIPTPDPTTDPPTPNPDPSQPVFTPSHVETGEGDDTMVFEPIIDCYPGQWQSIGVITHTAGTYEPGVTFLSTEISDRWEGSVNGMAFGKSNYPIDQGIAMLDNGVVRVPDGVVDYHFEGYMHHVNGKDYPFDFHAKLDKACSLERP